MTKRLLKLSFAALLMLGMPHPVMAAEAEGSAMSQAIDDDVNIAVSGQTVTISGAQGETLEVISLTGRRVMVVKIDSPAQRIELNIPKGCYILKVGKVVRKVSVH